MILKDTFFCPGLVIVIPEVFVINVKVRVYESCWCDADVLLWCEVEVNSVTSLYV